MHANIKVIKLPSERHQQVLETRSAASTAIFHFRHILHTWSPTATNIANIN